MHQFVETPQLFLNQVGFSDPDSGHRPIGARSCCMNFRVVLSLARISSDCVPVFRSIIACSVTCGVHWDFVVGRMRVISGFISWGNSESIYSLLYLCNNLALIVNQCLSVSAAGSRMIDQLKVMISRPSMTYTGRSELTMCAHPTPRLLIH